MKRTNVNFLIDATAFAGFVFLTATGVLVRYVLPPGSGRWTTVWGLDRHEWGSVHFWVSLMLLAVLSLHLFLHWKWIVSAAKGRPREGSGARLGLGAVGLVALVALAMAPLFSPIERADRPSSKFEISGRTDRAIRKIDGSMTLQELAELTGNSVNLVRQDLGLPPGIDPNERLGRLRRAYDFEMNEVRQFVEKRHKMRQ